MMVFYLWPRDYHGKRIGMVMTLFIFLLYGTSIAFVIANPEPQNTPWIEDRNNTDYNTWMSETGERLWVATVSFQVVGVFAFFLTILIILFEDNLVAKVVSKF